MSFECIYLDETQGKFCPHDLLNDKMTAMSFNDDVNRKLVDFFS